MDIEIGKTYSTTYPFVYEENEGMCMLIFKTDIAAEKKIWRPGTESEEDEFNGRYLSAQGIGEMFLTVVDVHKPKKFQRRVFYTRQFKDPDGNVFGRRGLMVSTIATFRRRIRGYAKEYWLNGQRITGD